MDKNQYLINLLLKDNNISANIKNGLVNVDTLDNRFNKASQTIKSKAADSTGNIVGDHVGLTGINKTVEKKCTNIDIQVRILENTLKDFYSLPGNNLNQYMSNESQRNCISNAMRGKECDLLGYYGLLRHMQKI